ncbi:hypothetical protein JG688_00017881 [Phytophthora aleatoria]|uniref:Uncharacterized protein n=1 Tax=Phytophthora aleatoria TaxID=2496075 RepID=A0A8J5I098_9STRA|nr:hypothetical protein JG688_00017881 [Phytophthora aleatoria]
MYRRTAIAYVHMKLVLDYIAEGHDLDETILRFYRLNKNRSKKKQINKWLKCEVTIRETCESGRGSHLNARQLRDATVLSKSAELPIVLRINTVRKEGVFVSWSMLRLQAKEVVSDIGLVKTCLQLQARG